MQSPSLGEGEEQIWATGSLVSALVHILEA